MCIRDSLKLESSKALRREGGRISNFGSRLSAARIRFERERYFHGWRWAVFKMWFWTPQRNAHSH
eukprot:2037941-Pyramimonas_sp.AAC.1